MSTLSSHDPEAAVAERPSTEPLSTEPQGERPGPGGTPRRGGAFRAFWRWHFYASVLVVPIMLMLSITGLVILFKDTLDPVLNPGVITVDVPGTGAPKALSAQEAAVRAAYPEARITAVQQGAEDRATFFTVTYGADRTRNVYVNPWTAKVTGSLDPARLPSNIATEIHGKIVFGRLSEVSLGTDPLKAVGATHTAGSEDTWALGDVGDRIIELAACWAVVMTLTGYYLFLRGRTARLRNVGRRLRAARLRNDHARYGAVLGIGFLLLVASGLPWTGVWGKAVQNLATGQGSTLWGDDPGAESTLGAKLTEIGSNAKPAPWAEGAAPMPESMPGMDHGTATGTSGATPVGIDQVVAAATADGAPGPYYVTYPDGAKGVYSVLADQWHDAANPAFSDVSKERTVHVDQYSGQVIGRYAFGQYSIPAQVVSQGIALHEGRRLGSFNLVASAAFCLGVAFACISGPILWWKRRPKGGGLAAPRGRMPLRTSKWLLAGFVVLAVFLPLFGVTLVLVLAFDRLVLPRLPRLAAALNRT